MYGFFRSFSFKRAVRVSSCADLRLRATLVSRQCPADGRKRPWASNNTYGHKNQIIQGYLATPMDARSHVETSARPSHGENRGSSPLGSANKINVLAEVSLRGARRDQR